MVTATTSVASCRQRISCTKSGASLVAQLVWPVVLNSHTVTASRPAEGSTSKAAFSVSESLTTAPLSDFRMLNVPVTACAWAATVDTSTSLDSIQPEEESDRRTRRDVPSRPVTGRRVPESGKTRKPSDGPVLMLV